MTIKKKCHNLIKEFALRTGWLSIFRSSRNGFWPLRVTLAILDQGLFSGGNFILSILLARWLAADDYGTFSVTFTIFLFLSGFHNALLLEPMSVIGPSQYADRLHAYLKGQVNLHFRLTTLLGICLVCVGGLFALFQTQPLLSRSLLGSGIALPLMLWVWLVRRAFYMFQKPGGAVLSSIVYLFTLLSSLWLLNENGVISAFNSFLLLGLAGLLGGMSAFWWKGKGLQEGRIPLSVLWKEQWRFGKWVVATNFLIFFTGQAQTLFTAGMVSLEAAGGLRAIQNFTQPMVQITTAIALLGIPVLSIEFGQGRLSSLRRKGILLTFVLTGVAVLYGLLLWMFSSPIEKLLYGGRYAEYSWLIPWAGMIPVLTAIGTGFSVMLRAIQKPQHFLIVGLVTAPVGLLTSILLIPAFNVAGSIASIVLTGVATVLITVYLYFIWYPKE
jgi:O-antigen/teichoic acid export membrane protein